MKAPDAGTSGRAPPRMIGELRCRERSRGSKRWTISARRRDKRIDSAETETAPYRGEVIFPKVGHQPPLRGCGREHVPASVLDFAGQQGSQRLKSAPKAAQAECRVHRLPDGHPKASPRPWPASVYRRSHQSPAALLQRTMSRGTRSTASLNADSHPRDDFAHESFATPLKDYAAS
jgi:hypothetical protein